MKKSRIVVFASGSGTNFETMVQSCQKGQLPAEVVLLVANNPQSRAIEKAKALDVPYSVINPSEFKDFDSWDKEVNCQVKKVKPDWVVLAGFMRKIGPHLLTSFEGKMINTHPSLLPKYGGKGMYGRRVHEAVIAQGETETGVTVHFVSSDYDEGPVIAQKVVPVLPTDTPEALEKRVKSQENLFYVETLKRLLTGQI